MFNFHKKDLWAMAAIVVINFLLNGGCSIAELIGLLIYSLTIVLVMKKWCLDDERKPLWKKFPKVIVIMAGIQTIIFSLVVGFGAVPAIFLMIGISDVLFAVLAIFIMKKKKEV